MKAIENYEEFITVTYADDITLIAKAPVTFQEAVDRWNETRNYMDIK